LAGFQEEIQFEVLRCLHRPPQVSQRALAKDLGVGLSAIKLFAKVPFRLATRRAGDLAIFYANPQRAFELLNWVAKRTLKDMCSSTWRFQKSVEFERNL
jgi:UDP-glucose 4-epimerase